MKKKAIILLINIIITTNLFSQPYQSIFGDSIAQWNVHVNGIDFQDMCICFSGKDTVIGTHHYKKIYDSCQVKNSSQCFLREDTLSGKVWLMNKSCTKEVIIMNLSLSLNDSFNFVDYNNTEDLIPVTNHLSYCDSVGYINGKKFIRFSYYYLEYIFLEGIGPLYGILPINNFTSIDVTLLCSYKDYKTTYKNPDWDTCFSFYVKTPKIKDNKKKFTIYPNPFSSRITIKTDSNEKGTFILSDMLNRVAIKHQISEKEVTIDVSFLAPGNYFYQIITNTGIESGMLIRVAE